MSQLESLICVNNTIRESDCESVLILRSVGGWGWGKKLKSNSYFVPILRVSFGEAQHLIFPYFWLTTRSIQFSIHLPGLRKAYLKLHAFSRLSKLCTNSEHNVCRRFIYNSILSPLLKLCTNFECNVCRRLI